MRSCGVVLYRINKAKLFYVQKYIVLQIHPPWHKSVAWSLPSTTKLKYPIYQIQLLWMYLFSLIHPLTAVQTLSIFPTLSFISYFFLNQNLIWALAYCLYCKDDKVPQGQLNNTVSEKEINYECWMQTCLLHKDHNMFNF